MTDTWDYRSNLDPEGDLPAEWVWERLRIRRDILLSQSDQHVTPDAPGGADAWRTYRQTLRDLPANTTDPHQAVWPDAPVSDTRNPNRAALEEQARQARAANRTFLAIASPTQAQSLAQIRALTRQNQGVIRLLLADVSGTD